MAKKKTTPTDLLDGPAQMPLPGLATSPLAVWVRSRAAGVLADTNDPPDSVEVDVDWEEHVEAQGWSESKTHAAVESGRVMAAEMDVAGFFTKLGNPLVFGDEPAWAEERIPGPDLPALLAGAPFGFKGRGRPKYTYSGLNIQLLTAWRIANATLGGSRDETEVPWLVRARRTALLTRYTAEEAAASVVAAWLYPVVNAGTVTTEALLGQGIRPEVVDVLDAACRQPGDTDQSWAERVVAHPEALGLVRARLIEQADPKYLDAADPTVRAKINGDVDRISRLLDAHDLNAVSPDTTRPAVVFGELPGLFTSLDPTADRKGGVWMGCREDDPDDNMGWLLPAHVQAVRELHADFDLAYNDWGDAELHNLLAPHLGVEPPIPLETLNVFGIQLLCLSEYLALGCPHRQVVQLYTNPNVPETSTGNYHTVRVPRHSGLDTRTVARIKAIAAKPITDTFAITVADDEVEYDYLD